MPASVGNILLPIAPVEQWPHGLRVQVLRALIQLAQTDPRLMAQVHAVLAEIEEVLDGVAA